MKPILLALTLLLVPAVVTAAEGEPIAIRFWEDHSISIESHSGLNLEIEPGSAPSDIKPPQHRVDQTVKAKSELDHLLSRKTNEKASSFAKLEAGQSIPPDGIRVRSENPSENEDAHGLRIELDGVTIAVPVSLGTKLSASQWEVEPADVLLIPMLEDEKTLASPALLAYFKALNPKRVIVSAEYPPQDLKVFQSAIGLATEPLTIEHNTFALSAGGLSRETAPQVVAVSDTPHELSETLETLFQAMEKSNLKSQQVFEKLSAKQLNFRPSNGTHTPRWNSEHMMGRQLGFFSQIFHAIGPCHSGDESEPQADAQRLCCGAPRLGRHGRGSANATGERVHAPIRLPARRHRSQQACPRQRLDARRASATDGTTLR